MKNIISFLALISLLSCSSKNGESNRSTIKVKAAEVLNQWHQAAASGNYTEYFSYFKDSSSVFMGTDATELWTVAEFAIWAKPYFKDDKAWEFVPIQRNLYYSNDSTTAWFDEELNNAHYGICRGTGVLNLIDGNWRIAHYNLTMPIPNAIIMDVRRQIKALDSLE